MKYLLPVLNLYTYVYHLLSKILFSKLYNTHNTAKALTLGVTGLNEPRPGLNWLDGVLKKLWTGVCLMDALAKVAALVFSFIIQIMYKSNILTTNTKISMNQL